MARLEKRITLDLKLASRHVASRYTGTRDAYHIVLSKAILNRLAELGVMPNSDGKLMFIEVLATIDDRPCIVLIPEDYYYDIIRS